MRSRGSCVAPRPPSGCRWEGGGRAPVVEDLRLGAPELTRTLTQDLAVAVAKSDRFPAEMEEIAATQEAAGQDGELYRAIAEVFRAAHDAAPEPAP